MPRGSRDAERIECFYRVMNEIEKKAVEDEEVGGRILTMKDFRNAVTEALFVVGRRTINDWFARCEDQGFIVKLGTTGNLHYNKERWVASKLYKAAMVQLASETVMVMEPDENVRERLR